MPAMAHLYNHPVDDSLKELKHYQILSTGGGGDDESVHFDRAVLVVI